VQSTIYKSGPYVSGDDKRRLILSAPNASLLNPVESTGIGVNEFIVAAARASGSGDQIRVANQTFIPLSANALGHLTCAFRVTSSSRDVCNLWIIGYTL
jgi:hypothetical protein